MRRIAPTADTHDHRQEVHPMTRYTITVPLQLNDGTPTPDAELARVEDDLLDVFGGYTATDGIGGYRGEAGRVYREPVRVFAVDSGDREDMVQRYMLALARQTAARLDQESVYITAQAITTDFVSAGVPVSA